MNVLLLSQFFSTTKGGGEYVFRTIADSLEKNNHKVWVITNNVSGEKYQESENLKILRVEPTLQYKGGLPPSFLDNIRYVLNAYKKAKEIIKNEEISIIHSNNFSPALAGSLLSYFTKIHHITTVHDIFSIYDKEFWKKWARQSNVSHTNARLVPLFEKIMMNLKIDRIHTVSDATKDDIQKLGTKKPIIVIPNCIQDEVQIATKTKPRQFACIGRLVFYKNLEVVLNAFKIISKEFPDAKLVIAGDGPHKESLQKLSRGLKIDKNIVFRGHVNSDEKKVILAESNALLFPSLMEGFGLVMLESWQQKRPVLASDIPPMSDIIEHNKTGLIIDPNDEKKWAEQIIGLVKNPQISDEMGREGNKILKEKYNQQLFYENLIKMYNDVLKSRD
ncbi:glycosyltransferase family 4 protein [Nitrosopumilus sp. K4]|uniref:glycosyltransferase family 4 protein n=1 Tax=Nitrosopumilus sp. K4 TaxID=2795383 RepID=UPI001BAAE6E0|nr:glycosyltransferase family 4 protein [Nitrosopumilus sp. K4]QUC64781.1 glycosyltransferase family 4 protein [Nitrosopumilus sp. K4]